MEEDSTIRNFEIVQKEGNREASINIAHYKKRGVAKFIEKELFL